MYDRGLQVKFLAACVNGEVESVKSMLKHSPGQIDLNYQERNTTPLIASVSASNLEILKALIEAGADINFLNREKVSPLYVAISMGRVEIANELLDKKEIEINNLDKYGNSLLIIASGATYEGATEIVKKLIEKGANIDQVNNSKESPLDVAKYVRNSATVELLSDQLTTSSPASTSLKQKLVHSLGVMARAVGVRKSRISPASSTVMNPDFGGDSVVNSIEKGGDSR